MRVRDESGVVHALEALFQERNRVVETIRNATEPEHVPALNSAELLRRALGTRDSAALAVADRVSGY